MGILSEIKNLSMRVFVGVGRQLDHVYLPFVMVMSNRVVDSINLLHFFIPQVGAEEVDFSHYHLVILKSPPKIQLGGYKACRSVSSFQKDFLSVEEFGP